MHGVGGYIRAVIAAITPERLVNPILGSVVVGSVAWARSTGEWIILIGGAVSAVAYVIKTIFRPLWKKLDAIVVATEQVPEIKKKLDDAHSIVADLRREVEELKEARRDPSARTRLTDRWEIP